MRKGKTLTGRPIKEKEDALSKTYDKKQMIYVPKVLQNLKLKLVEVKNGR